MQPIVTIDGTDDSFHPLSTTEEWGEDRGGLLLSLLSPSLSSVAWKRGCVWCRICRARKLSHTFAVFLVAALLPFLARAQEATDPASRQVPLKKGDRIIFFGDSLTALAIKDPNVPEGKGYVPLIRAALQDRAVDVDAVATGGHKVTDLLKRVNQDVLSKKPTIVVIQIGVNDASAGVTPELFKVQLEELIGQLQQGGARVIQCTCTCRIEGYNPENEMDKKLDALAEAARGIAREKQLPLVDLRKAFIDFWKVNNPENKPRGVLTYDGNHWTETGHKYVAEQMLKKFKY